MNMKPIRSTLFSLVLFLMALQPALAFYDPGVQRWLTRDPVAEPGFAAITRSQQTLGGGVEPDGYLLLGNDPLNRTDSLGLKDWESLIGAAEEAAKTATPGGEFVAALKIFSGCNDLGLALAWAKTQYNDCMSDAILGDPRKGAAAERACDKKWTPKIKLLQSTYDALCRKRSCIELPLGGGLELL
jgi:hypothetical protein